MALRFTLLFLISSIVVNAQITYQKLFITVNGSQTTSIKHTSDGGFISSGGGSAGYWVIKADQNGDIQWMKNLSNAYRIFSIRQTSDGGYAGCGYGNNGSGKNHALLVKFSPAGAIQWSKLYGDTATSSATDLEETPSGAFVLSGNIGSVAALQDVYVIKTDSTGNLLWANRYASPTQVANITSSIIVAGGSYYVSGNTQFSITSSDALLLKLNAGGQLLWSYSYDVSGNREFANEVRESTDGNLLISGFNEAVYPNPDASLTKLDTSGAVLWGKAYSTPGLDYAFSLYQNPDQSIVFTGSSDSTTGGNSSRDVMLIKTDGSGNLIWSRQFGGNGLEQPLQNCLDKTIDGGYIIQATSLNSFSSNLSYSTYVIKTDGNGNAGCNMVPNSFATSNSTYIRSAYPLTKTSEGSEQTISFTPVDFGNDSTLCFFTGIGETEGAGTDIQMYPNPATDHLTINSTERITSYRLFSADGKSLGEEVLVNDVQTTIKTAVLPSGIYLLNITTAAGKKTALFTKE